MRLVEILLASMVISLVSCSKNPSSHTDRIAATPSPIGEHAKLSATVGGTVDASTLLTAEEIERILGEPLKNKIPSTRTEAGFVISQCYFALATASKSLVVTVTNPGAGPQVTEPREFWAEKFEGAKIQGSMKEPESSREKHERPQPAPEKIADVGDDAYWVPSGGTGALYVLHANSLIRLALGGNDEKALRVQKAVALAKIAVGRL